MNKAFLLILLLFSPTFAEVGFKDRPITNIVMMQTGYTLNQGEFIYGIGLIEYGITDRWQIGTDILLTFLENYYNVMPTITIIQSRKMAFATVLGLSYSGKSENCKSSKTIGQISF